MHLNKPVKLTELTQAIQRLLADCRSPPLARRARAAERSPAARRPIIFVVDDDSHMREAIRAVLEDDGRTVEDYATCEAFLEAYRPGRDSLPADRCLSAGDERARIAAAARR